MFTARDAACQCHRPAPDQLKQAALFSMENAHKRKKQPLAVRRALLDEVTQLAVTRGLQAVTVQAVADAAGVTKGGFMHHFPHKQALIDTLFAELLAQLGQELDEFIAADPEPYGAFTRAYVQATLALDWEGSANPVASLSVLMLTDATLREAWAQWFNARLRYHHATDGSLELVIVRLAADGIWLADIARLELPDRTGLEQHLIARTYPPTSLPS